MDCLGCLTRKVTSSSPGVCSLREAIATCDEQRSSATNNVLREILVHLSVTGEEKTTELNSAERKRRNTYALT